MPRKVDPHWGEDGYDGWLPVTLADAEVADLAKMLGIRPGSLKSDDLQSAITYIGNAYRRWKNRGAGAFSRAEARRALEMLLEIDHIDYAVLTTLNERAFQCVHDSLIMTKPAPVDLGDSVVRALMEKRLDGALLRHAVKDAIARLKAMKGPERDGDLAWAVAELCRLYEEATGRRATHSSKDKDITYQQEPHSEAGQFVRMCFRLIDEKASATQINRALRYFIENRK